MKHPSISIAMATYNGEKFIAKQLDSILQQTFEDWELVVCDDKSTDKTFEILNEFKKNDSRLKIHENTTNLGFKKNFEKITSICSGEFIVFCDQDDIWTPDHIETLYREIENYDCICANAQMIDDNGNSLGITMRDFIPVHILPTNNKFFYKHELYGNIVQGAACMIRRSLLEKALPIPESVKFHDWWFALMACEHGGCKYIDKTILQYRRHDANVSQCDKFDLKEAILLFFRKRDSWISSYQDSILLLNEFEKRNPASQRLNWIHSAKRFYLSLLNNNDYIWRFIHYFKNYNIIQLSFKRNLMTFTYRLLALAIKGVKI